MPISNMSKEPSIIQASDAETAHREQYPQPVHQQQQSGSKATKHSHAQHHHLHHRRLRQRQAESIPPSDIPDVVPPPAVTEVLQTVSIIQQINVDEAGNTLGTTTYTNTSAEPIPTASDVPPSPMPSSQLDDPVSSYPATTPDDLPSETVIVIPTVTTDALPMTSQLPQTELSETELPTTDSPAPEIPTQSEFVATFSTQGQFASLIPSINATSTISSSSYTTFLSSTISSASSNSGSTTSSPSSSSTTSVSIDSILSSLSSTSSGTFLLNAKFGSGTSSIETTSTYSDSTYTSVSEAYPSTTDGGALIGGGAIGAPNTPLSTDSNSATDSANKSNDDPAPLTPPKVAGVVVGSLAAVAFILVIAFFILKRLKQKRGGAVRLSTGSQQLRLAGGGAAPMQERNSPFLPIFNAFRSRPKEIAGTSEAGGSEEPSFVRVSGRKLPSVIRHGGDGYGGPGEVPPIPQHLSQQLNDASFYADDTGYHGGVGENTGVSTAIAGSGLVSGAAAKQRDRSPGRQPSSSPRQPNTPFRGLHDLQNPFSSPSDQVSSSPMREPLRSPGNGITREGPMRNVAVVSGPNRSLSHHLMVSEGLASGRIPSHTGQLDMVSNSPAQSSSPVQRSPTQPLSGNTESSGSTRYTDARGEPESLATVLKRPDPLGRSLASQDGSRGSTSRFREDV